jgi:hypothetical protein
VQDVHIVGGGILPIAYDGSVIATRLTGDDLRSNIASLWNNAIVRGETTSGLDSFKGYKTRIVGRSHDAIVGGHDLLNQAQGREDGSSGKHTVRSGEVISVKVSTIFVLQVVGFVPTLPSICKECGCEKE